MPIFAMPLVMAADIMRWQLRLVRTENLDNSQYTRMTVPVVCPICILISIPLMWDGYLYLVNFATELSTQSA